jgi:acetoacetate decarboxylase
MAESPFVPAAGAAADPDAYRGMPPTVWAPPAPQLIRGARMLIVGYQADPEALAEVLPPGLTPHSNNLVQMNMYEVTAEQTSGFGAFSLTYLTVEVEGHDSLAAEGAMPIPGRFFAYYWNSSARVIAYAREGAGIPAQYGTRRSTVEAGVLTSVLTVDGADVVTARATVTDNPLGTLGGHLNYYAHRQIPRPEGGRAALSELIELPLPFVADLYEATVDDVAFDFPEGHPAARLAPVTPLSTPSVMWADVTFTYSMGRVIRDYLAEA